MTAIDTTNLETLANTSFDDFKNAWIKGNATGNDVASRYYEELKNQGTATRACLPKARSERACRARLP
jgi:hypothetical protein